MDKDKNSSEEEVQDVTAEPVSIMSQARTINVFESFNDND